MMLQQASRGWHVARPSTGRPRQAIASPRAAGGAELAKTQPVTVQFKAGGKEATVEANAGENILEVAKRCGIDIQVGCHQGNCGICEMEIVKVDSGGVARAITVARTCIVGIPPGYATIEVNELEDAIWGVDGYDT